MGKLNRIVYIEQVTEDDELYAKLSNQFGLIWNQILLGGDKPLGYHSYNEVYLGIEELEFGDRGTVLELIKEQKDVYNIIAS